MDRTEKYTELIEIKARTRERSLSIALRGNKNTYVFFNEFFKLFGCFFYLKI